MLAELVYLESYLAPFAPYLARNDVTDIYVNRPGELWVEALGGVPERIEAPELTRLALTRLAKQIAAINAQGINRQRPLLSATLPDGARVQIVLPPATRGEVAIAIRRHVMAEMSLDDYAEPSTEAVALAATKSTSSPTSADKDNVSSRLRSAILRRKNILISGGTSAGKTTFLNALLKEIPRDERLIFIEDTPELRMTHANTVGLLAARGEQGEAEVTAEDLLIASLRMRPDRIILGEMRGSEALTFLRAINTGHPGSISTIHADSPERAIDQLVLLVLQAGTKLEWQDVARYVRRSVDVIVHLGRANGKRAIESVMELGRMPDDAGDGRSPQP